MLNTQRVLGSPGGNKIFIVFFIIFMLFHICIYIDIFLYCNARLIMLMACAQYK